MASVVIPPGYAYQTAAMRLAGMDEDFIITAGWRMVLASTPNQLTADGLQIITRDALDQITSTTTTWKGGTLRWRGATGDVMQFDTSLTGSGSGVAARLPPNCAYLITRRTNSAGRWAKGRLYFPSVDEAQVDNLGFLNATHQSAVNADFATWLTNMVGHADVEAMVILHSVRKNGSLPAPTEVNSLFCEPKIATQRRRLR